MPFPSGFFVRAVIKNIKITILPTIRAYPWGAPGHCMGALVEELLAAGHEVPWLVAPIDDDHPEVARLKSRGAKVERLPEERPGYVRWAPLRWRLRELAGVPTLGRVVGQFRPDHIFVNQGATWCSLQREIWEVLEAHRGKYSIICHLGRPRGIPAESRVEDARKMATSAVCMYFPSRWVQRLAEEQIGKNIPNSRFFHYPHRFTFDEPLPWPKSPKPTFALVSRLDADHKGIDLALEALGRLHQEGTDFLFTMYGSGPDEEKLRRMAEKLGLQEKVSFAGYADDVEKVWRENKILLLPSRREGCAVAMTEAMAFGRPVIATAVGGAPDWIEDGKEGFLCAVADAGQLTQTLRRALQERDRWREMGEAAHRKIKERLPARPARLFLESL